MAGFPVKSLLARVLLFGTVWSCLNGGDLASWVVGGPAVGAAAWLSLRLRREKSASVRWTALPAFALYFVRESFLGGLDVARRVMAPGLPVNPGFVRYDMSLPEGAARNFFVNTVSLLPGTVAAGLEGDSLLVHAIDAKRSLASDLRKLEGRVERLLPREGASQA